MNVMDNSGEKLKNFACQEIDDLTSKDAYKTLDQRLNLFPQGAPPSESLYQILPVLLSEQANHILDYERASYLIDTADYVGVGTCYCRHKKLHLGIECSIRRNDVNANLVCENLTKHKRPFTI